MRVLITGHSGFIATNLVLPFERLGHTVVSPDLLKLHRRLKTGEHCVYSNSELDWTQNLGTLGVDVIVHNAAVVGTDVVALDPQEATLTNVTGTYNICRAAEKLRIPVLYLGTTVIYDSDIYQDLPITEVSSHAPKTLYGSLKLAGEHIVSSHCKKWAVVRPLFCYGGIGDNNSLIAKGFYAGLTGKSHVDMFLDPERYKDYMRVEDFCDAVAFIVHEGMWGTDWNIAAETPVPTGKIIDMMSEISGIDIGSIVRWYPKTDYLGNHRLSSDKFRFESGWRPNNDLYGGLAKSWDDLRQNLGSTDYNPLKYLETAEKNQIDLTQFFNR